MPGIFDKQFRKSTTCTNGVTRKYLNGDTQRIHNAKISGEGFGGWTLQELGELARKNSVKVTDSTVIRTGAIGKTTISNKDEFYGDAAYESVVNMGLTDAELARPSVPSTENSPELDAEVPSSGMHEKSTVAV